MCSFTEVRAKVCHAFDFQSSKVFFKFSESSHWNSYYDTIRGEPVSFMTSLVYYKRPSNYVIIWISLSWSHFCHKLTENLLKKLKILKIESMANFCPNFNKTVHPYSECQRLFANVYVKLWMPTNGMHIPANSMRMRTDVCIKYEYMSMYALNVRMTSSKCYIIVNVEFVKVTFPF